MSTKGNRAASHNEHMKSQTVVGSSQHPLRSRSWWPITSADDSLLHESNSGATEEVYLASQAGEAIGEYVMYRF